MTGLRHKLNYALNTFVKHTPVQYVIRYMYLLFAWWKHGNEGASVVFAHDETN